MEKTKNKVGKWLLLVVTILFNIFILVESLLPADLSGLQSNFLANLFSIFYTPPAVIEVEEIAFNYSDNKIVKGTTKSFDLTYYPSDAEEEQIEIINTYSKEKFNIVQDGKRLYIEGFEIGQYEIKAQIEGKDEINTSLKFEVIERKIPSNYTLNVENHTIKVGYSEKINVLLSSSGLLKDEIRQERTYDKSKITYEVDNKDVVEVDEYGVIHALSVGEATITSFPLEEKINIKVVENDAPLIYPTKLDIQLSDDIHVYDSDYIESEDIECSKIEANFIGENPSDTSITYISENDLIARVSGDGYIYGYKKSGTVRIYAFSNMDNNVYDYIDVVVGDVIPTSMSVNLENNSLSRGASLTIRPTFAPINTTNTSIAATSSDEDILKVINNGRTVTIQGVTEGEAYVEIISNANPSLKQNVKINVTQPLPSEDESYDDFVGFIRKSLGHFLLFFIDGALIYFSFYMFLKDNEKIKLYMILLFTIGSGFLLGCLSELLQFIPQSRFPSFIDICIDTLGVVIMSLIIYACMVIYKKIKEKKKK